VRRKGPLPDRLCECGCGHSLARHVGEGFSEFKWRRFASRACANRVTQAARKQRLNDEVSSRICLSCGKSLARRPDENGAHAKCRRYCGQRCFHESRFIRVAVCRVCGKGFNRQPKSGVVLCSPECRDATQKAKAIWVDVEGVRMTLTEIAAMLGVSVSAVSYRRRVGAAMVQPPRKRRRLRRKRSGNVIRRSVIAGAGGNGGT